MAPLTEPRSFRGFTIHPEFHTLVWPNGADFAPEFLHDSIRVETVVEHPWAALAIGTWLRIVVTVVLSALKECVATLATGKGAPEPDWRAMSRMHDALDVPKRARRSRGRETRPKAWAILRREAVARFGPQGLIRTGSAGTAE